MAINIINANGEVINRKLWEDMTWWEKLWHVHDEYGLLKRPDGKFEHWCFTCRKTFVH